MKKKLVNFKFDVAHDDFIIFGIGEHHIGNRYLDKDEKKELYTDYNFKPFMFEGPRLLALFISKRQPNLVGYHTQAGTYVVYGKNNDDEVVMLATDLMQVAFYVLQNGTVDEMFTHVNFEL